MQSSADTATDRHHHEQSLDITTILVVFLIPILFVVIGVSLMWYQCKRLANQINNDKLGDHSAATATYQTIMADLASLREEHRTDQERVKADIKAEMDTLKKLQTDMSTQMGEIMTLVQQLAEAQKQQHCKED